MDRITPNLEKEPTMRNNMSLAYLAYVCTFIALVLFMVGCNPMESKETMYTETDYAKVSTQYVHEAYTGPSCWVPNGSTGYEIAVIEGYPFQVAPKARFRAVMLPHPMIDVLIEGAVNTGDWAFFQDTTTGITYVLNVCNDQEIPL